MQQLSEFGEDEPSFTDLQPWGKGQDGDSDFAYNMRTVANSDAITWKQGGIAAYLIEGYRRDKAREIEREVVAKAQADSEWIGVEGQRVTVPAATVTRVSEHESQWGVSFLVSMLDQAGNVVNTWTSAPWAEDLEAGEILDVTGTIKKLDEYRGVKQTTLTRVRVK